MVRRFFNALTEGLLANIVPGWKPVPDAPRSFINPAGWGILWFFVDRGKGYEQPTITEAPGVMIVARDAAGRVGFVVQHRATAPRLASLMPHRPGYMRRFLEANAMADLGSALGQDSYELPAGIWKLPPGEGVDHLATHEDFIRSSVTQEAREELGATDLVFEKFGVEKLNPNPVFFTHAHHMAVVRVGHVGRNSPEGEEIIRRIVWLEPIEIHEMIRDGRIVDARTTHTLVWAGVL